MIKTDKLIGCMAENGYSKTRMAKALGITPKTFYLKLARGVFGSDEIEKMIKLLNIEDPCKIFFADE